MLSQGDSTISEYCQRIKLKAAELRAVGHPIEGRQLVLAMLRGLQPRFASTVDDITNSTVLPSFSRAHDMLVLKETRLSSDEKAIASTAHIASVGSGCTSPGGCRSTSSSASSSGPGGGQPTPPKPAGNSGNRRKGGGRQQEGWRWQQQRCRRWPCTTAQQQRHRLQHLLPHGPLDLLQSLGATGCSPPAARRREL